MMAKGYAAQSASTPLAPYSFQRRDVGANDVQIGILFCGVCHSDIHQVRNEWGGSIFPMVPGHEIVGRVTQVGAKVKKFKPGDLAGVGCFVDSCRTCVSCQAGNEQYCEGGMVGTYNSYEKDGITPTYGGYSNHIVVNQNYVLHISDQLPLQAVAPLLCAGITTYSPLKHWGVGKGQQVAVVGLGGLGHMGVKLAASFGAEVTVLSSSVAKKSDALRLGAQHFHVVNEKENLHKLRNHFDFVLNTISAPHNVDAYLSMVKTDGAMVIVGIPPEAIQLSAFSLITKRKTLAGSMIGGIRETQEMLDYCATHQIVSDVELIAMQDIEKAYARMLKGDVRYRFVIDMATV